MPRLPVFLALSVLLHLAAASTLLWRDARGDAVPVSAPAAQRQPVVVISLAAPVQAVQRVQPANNPVKPVKSAVRAKQAKPAKTVASQLPKKVPTDSSVQASRSDTSVTAAPAPPHSDKPATNHLQAQALARSAAASSALQPLEVFSRQPAFRLPPQQPRYPSQARRRNQQGVVLLEVRLDARGGQREIKLIRSSGFPSLDSAALEAVSAWRFHPETINGRGVPSRVQIPIEFALLASR